MDSNETPPQWAPNDWLRIIALIGGFALFFIGCWMLYKGVHAEGSVDLKLAVLSGTVQASSAGLYICFFALSIIVFVLTTIWSKDINENNKLRQQSLRFITILWSILISIFICLLGMVFFPDLRPILLFIIGFLLATLSPVIILIIRVPENLA